MDTTGWTRSNGRVCHPCRSSSTATVPRLISSGETSTSYISRRCARMSRVVSPRAYQAMMRSLHPSRRVWPLCTICGLKLPARSRGISRSMPPISVNSRLPVTPLRLLPDPRSAGSYFHSSGARSSPQPARGARGDRSAVNPRVRLTSAASSRRPQRRARLRSAPRGRPWLPIRRASPRRPCNRSWHTGPARPGWRTAWGRTARSVGHPVAPGHEPGRHPGGR